MRFQHACLAGDFNSINNIIIENIDISRIDIKTLVSDFRKRRWTLFSGVFGIGKTTMALHSSEKITNGIIYIRSEDLQNPFGSVGTNYLMQKIVQSLDLFGEYDDETAPEFERLQGHY